MRGRRSPVASVATAVGDSCRKDLGRRRAPAVQHVFDVVSRTVELTLLDSPPRATYFRSGNWGVGVSTSPGTIHTAMMAAKL
jgi:hypothetical protein